MGSPRRFQKADITAGDRRRLVICIIAVAAVAASAVSVSVFYDLNGGSLDPRGTEYRQIVSGSMDAGDTGYPIGTIPKGSMVSIRHLDQDSVRDMILIIIVALILIYIIKPNYQQKFISSTYVWKLSLKLKRKKLPLNRLRNILLLLCQILFLASCAMALSQPVIMTNAEISSRDVVAIIDSSASMRAGENGDTRINRAVESVKNLADEVYGQGGLMTVIVAGEECSLIVQRSQAASRATLEQGLDKLLSTDDGGCSYGPADIDAAMVLCEEIVGDNSEAEIYLYTDTEYAYKPANVEVINVSAEDEWNAAILDAYTVVQDNYYVLYVQVACYGVNEIVSLDIQVNGRNGNAGDTLNIRTEVACSNDQVMTVILRDSNQPAQDYEQTASNISVILLEHDTQAFYSYQDIQIVLSTSGGIPDSFSYDNSFAIYDGDRETINVLYASSLPNPWLAPVINAYPSMYFFFIKQPGVPENDRAAGNTYN